MAALIPRLFRYQHDPNAGVREAMTRIWQAVVPDDRCALVSGKPQTQTCQQHTSVRCTSGSSCNDLQCASASRTSSCGLHFIPGISFQQVMDFAVCCI